MALPLCAIVAGLWQIGFALSGVSRVIKMAPYPVIAGFVSGVGLLIILHQIPTLAGTGSLGEIAQGAGVSPSRLVLAALVIAAILALDRWVPRLPSLITGLVFGYAIYHAVGFLFPAIDLGPMVGTIEISDWAPVDLTAAGSLISAAENATIPLLVLGGSLTLAVAGTLDTGFALEAVRNLANIPVVDQKRDLIGQGTASVVSAASGGLFVSTSLALTAANYRAGGRSRWSAFFCAAFLALGVALLPQLIFSLPLVVLAGILVVVGYNLIDRWAVDVCRQALVGADVPARAQNRRNATIVLAVTGATVLGEPIVGAAAGAALASVVFVMDMNRPAVLRKATAEALTSKRVRSAAHDSVLDEGRSSVMVVRLQGVLFFGNADEIRAEIDSLPAEVAMLILDFRLVTNIDVSGAIALRHACDRLRSTGRKVRFSGLRNPAVEQAVRDMATGDDVHSDLDAALEHCEDEILSGYEGGTASFYQVNLEDSDFGKSMERNDFAELVRHMRRVVFPSGALLCRTGDPSDRLWILTRGSISVWMTEDGSRRRLASIGPGCTVGEMGLLNKVARSADVCADDEVHAYELTAETLREILEESPHVGQAVLTGIARQLSHRLRTTSSELRLADS